jgi:hypothetical protein
MSLVKDLACLMVVFDASSMSVSTGFNTIWHK